MSLSPTCKYGDSYYDHVLNKKKTEGNLGKVFDIIHDLNDRRGLRQEWEEIDDDIQEEIIEKWLEILNSVSL